MEHEVYLSLGSNVGNREENLLEAVRYISLISSTCVDKVSNIYETDPVGYTEQDRFLNAAAAIRTGLEPLDLLEELQRVEALLKRVREIRWGPRTIDIDILLYDDRKIDLPGLTVPHPRIFERGFVLIPLRDIYLYKKINNLHIDKLIDTCNDRDGVKLYRQWSMDRL